MQDRAQQGGQAQQGEQGRQGRQGAQDQQGKQGGQGQQGQGQQGQQGQQGGQGAQDGQAGGGDRTAGGAAYGGGYGRYWDGTRWVGGYSPDDVRQFRNELRQWQADAQQLRQQLQNQGVDVRDLDQALRDLRTLDSEQAFVDPASLAALQASALDKLKKFEFNLRKKAEGSEQPLMLSGSDEVPAGFRSAIEEYYRALAKKN
jgi:hypothetical protein